MFLKPHVTTRCLFDVYLSWSRRYFVACTRNKTRLRRCDLSAVGVQNVTTSEAALMGQGWDFGCVQSEGVRWVVVAQNNFGQGGSTELGALEARHLGGRLLSGRCCSEDVSTNCFLNHSSPIVSLLFLQILLRTLETFPGVLAQHEGSLELEMPSVFS